MAKLSSVCVYCGSSNTVPESFLEAAEELGRRIAEAGLRLVYGGGTVGLMHRVATGAAAANGAVTGIIPGYLRNREGRGPTPGEIVVVDTMHERKRQMAERAQAFAVLPGGFGTLDELFEIVTWRQLGLHDRPIVLVNLAGYWTPLLEMLDRMATTNFVDAASRRLIVTVSTVAEVVPALLRQDPATSGLGSDLV